MTSGAWNASELYHQPTDPLDIQPESDISGFGVFVGFVSASYVMLVIVIIYYIFGYDPALNPFGVAENSTPTRTRPNPFDQLVLRVARWILRIDATKWQASYKDGRFAAAFDKCVISMADIQMVNGLAILIAGLVLLPQRLSALHWKMVVYLAWFSCTTNLSALTFLRPHMIRSTFERVWRLGSAFVLLVALVVCLIPTGHFFWLTDSQGHREDAAPSAYAICYFNVEYRGDSFTGKNSMLLSILLLVFSYAVRILKLYRGFTCRGPTARPLSDFLVNGCLKSAARLQGMIGTSSFAERMASNLIVAAHFVVCLWIDISTSMASDIFWLIISMTWGSQRTAELRGILDASPAADADPKWSFGQILAVLLVIGPLLGLVRSGRDMFTSNPHESPRTSIVGPDRDGSFQERAGVVYTGSQESRPDTSQPAAEGDISRSSGRSDPGVLDPNLFTEYCKKSAWMGWAPAICLSYTLPAAVTLLTSQSDPISQLQNLLFWFVLEQGAVLQQYIVIGFYIDKKLKSPAVHVFICCFMAVAVYGAVFARGRYLLAPFQLPRYRGLHIPAVFVCVTFNLFIVALLAARLPRMVQVARQAVGSFFSATPTVSGPGATPARQEGQEDV